ncbi:hypothetical protein BH10PSE3_BH10PSE3_07640 [soil metagenome]
MSATAVPRFHIDQALHGYRQGHRWLSGSIRLEGQAEATLLTASKIQGARAGYANYDVNKENPILLRDSTFWGSAKQGFLLTDRSIFTRVGEERQVISLNDISDVDADGNFLILNGRKFYSFYDSQTAALVADYLSRLLGLLEGAFQSKILAILASQRFGLDELWAAIGQEEPIKAVYHREKSEWSVLSHKAHYFDSFLSTSNNAIVFSKRDSAFDVKGTFVVLPLSAFNTIRIVNGVHHEHGHSHTPHAVSHVLKHATNLNIAMAAVSIFADAYQRSNPPPGIPIFDVYIQRDELIQDGKLDEKSYHHVFKQVNRQTVEKMIEFFANTGLSVVYSSDSPFGEWLDKRNESSL